MIMTLACQHVHIFVSPWGYLTLYSFMFLYVFFVEFSLIKQILPLKNTSGSHVFLT